jgi:hypothetical protein
MELTINSIEMTGAVMQKLEDLGLIERLLPSKESFRRYREETGSGVIYQSASETGSHKLVFCCIDRPEFSAFGHHEDNEEFILLGGGDGEKDLYFMTATCDSDTLNKKIAAHKLSSEDFICFKIKYNDPLLSFFVMKKNIPHGECTCGQGKAATFYVTEGSGITVTKTDFKDYSLNIVFSPGVDSGR